MILCILSVLSFTYLYIFVFIKHLLFVLFFFFFFKKKLCKSCFWLNTNDDNIAKIHARRLMSIMYFVTLDHDVLSQVLHCTTPKRSQIHVSEVFISIIIIFLIRKMIFVL
jgi:hypothetical protein